MTASAIDAFPLEVDTEHAGAIPEATGRTNHDLHRLGKETLGPIFAEFALRLCAYLTAVPRPETARLLFCARGGLRLRLIYERFLKRTGLASPVAFDDIMISRVVAARGAMLAGAPGALEEIGREFAGGSMRDVASALTGEAVDGASFGIPEAELDASFDGRALSGLVFAGSGELTLLGQAIRVQDQRFLAHLASKGAGSQRIILCDTGLYGSTIRMLRQGVPDVAWSCVLFARSNYKGFDESHFSCTTGLSVDRNGYAPLDRRTAALRYWQVIEDLLEPALPSVRRFDVSGSSVVSNLEREGWRARVEPEPGTLFHGIVDYIDALPAEGYAAMIHADARDAWKRLRRIIVWPRPAEAALLLVGERSRDFGRMDTVQGLEPAAAGLAQAIAAVRRSLWREGAAALQFPRSRLVLQAGLEAFHILRFLRKRRR
jgi:hypothetical protein